MLVLDFDTWYIHAPAREQIREELLNFIWPSMPDLHSFFREHFSSFIDMRVRHFRDSLARYFRDRSRGPTTKKHLSKEGTDENVCDTVYHNNTMSIWPILYPPPIPPGPFRRRFSSTPSTVSNDSTTPFDWDAVRSDTTDGRSIDSMSPPLTAASSPGLPPRKRNASDMFVPQQQQNLPGFDSSNMSEHSIITIGQESSLLCQDFVPSSPLDSPMSVQQGRSCLAGLTLLDESDGFTHSDGQITPNIDSFASTDSDRTTLFGDVSRDPSDVSIHETYYDTQPTLTDQGLLLLPTSQLASNFHNQSDSIMFPQHNNFYSQQQHLDFLSHNGNNEEDTGDLFVQTSSFFQSDSSLSRSDPRFFHDLSSFSSAPPRLPFNRATPYSLSANNCPVFLSSQQKNDGGTCFDCPPVFECEQQNLSASRIKRTTSVSAFRAL